MPKGIISYFSEHTDRDNEIVAMYKEQRLTGRKIALLLGENKATIYKVLERNGVARNKFYTFSGNNKSCPNCGNMKDHAEFSRKGLRISSWCKECRKEEKRNIETSAIWQANNRDKLRASWKRKNEREKKYPVKCLHTRIRTSIHDCFEAKRHKKNPTFQILGYTPYELKAHLEKLFSAGMSWENRGDWHIDHIRPLASFHFNSDEDIKEAWALINLRPLWAIENIKKSSFFNREKHFHKK